MDEDYQWEFVAEESEANQIHSAFFEEIYEIALEEIEY